ncbi:HIT family protein [Aquipuribacter sp. SD81]|uniref:HIT family protein n=1 Tax=Aquipuribacter sp. SD81 TaxID=3127703 RepID=UPI00301658E9
MAPDYTPRGSRARCVFCAVVAGAAPAHEVLRTDRVVGFLDRNPLFHGHVLLVPVVHVQTHDEIPADLATDWLAASQALQRAVEQATGADGALLIVNNVVSQSVPHVHQHVIPRHRDDGLSRWLGPRRRYRDDAHAAATAAAVRAALTLR